MAAEADALAQGPKKIPWRNPTNPVAHLRCMVGQCHPILHPILGLEVEVEGLEG